MNSCKAKLTVSFLVFKPLTPNAFSYSFGSISKFVAISYLHLTHIYSQNNKQSDVYQSQLRANQRRLDSRSFPKEV
jgi:hypothetical protein